MTSTEMTMTFRYADGTAINVTSSAASNCTHVGFNVPDMDTLGEPVSVQVDDGPIEPFPKETVTIPARGEQAGRARE